MPAKDEERNLFSGRIKNRQGIIIAGYIRKIVKVEGYRIQRLQIGHQQRGLPIHSTSTLQQKADTGNQS